MSTQSDLVTIEIVLATRYLSAVALALSLYDHAITFPTEVQLFWSQPWSASHALVVFSTYFVQACCLVIAYTFGDSRSTLSYKVNVIIFIGTFATMGGGCQEVALLLRVYALWDNRKKVKHALLFGFAVCYGFSLASAIVTMAQLAGGIRCNVDLRTCVLPEKAKYIAGVWGGMAAYDLYVLILAVLNAFNRPRRRDTEILDRLRRDGILTFLLLFASHLVKLLPSILANASATFLLPVLTWAIDTRLVYRLFIKVGAVELRANQASKPAFGQPQASVFVSEEVELRYI
ncbi:hypothetical protein C8Q72DRAFT_501193 [Fomitopsis betulina]|nr:hypothetical protein C8Q72DRAFT_501193 [Fomitopsis betulina]